MLNRWGFEPRPEDSYGRCGSDKIRQTVPVFQTRAAATGKARSPTVDSRVRLTISDEDELERSRWPASIHIWQSSSVRYAGADPRRHLYTRTEYLNALLSGVWSLQPVQRTQERSDVLELWWGKNKPSSGIHHWLQPWEEMWWNADQCRIAVVQPREDERRHQRLENGSRHWPTDGPQLTQYKHG